jgi:hypothetical protein
MQVNLPVHQPARDKKLLDRIDTFLFHHQISVMHSQHFQDTVIPNHAFGHSGKKTITREVIHPVNIQLTGYKLMKERFMIIIGKNPDSHLKLAGKLFV